MLITTANALQAIDRINREKPRPSFKTQNRPIINLLASFASLYNSAHLPDWLVRLEDFGGPKSEVRIQKDDYLSLMVLSVIQGFETYLKCEIWIAANVTGHPELASAARKLPRGKSTVQHLFNDLPSKLHPDLAIDRVDPDAAAFFREFYKTVRNPLSHGDQLAGADAYNFLCFLEWYRRGYEWLAGWGVPGAYLEFDGKYLQVRELFPAGDSTARPAYEK